MHAADMFELESVLHPMLTSAHPSDTKHGLANVIYWGYAQIGFGLARFNRFCDCVTDAQIAQFQNLVKDRQPSLSDIKSLGMPEYSAISFTSKILAFLNPAEFCVLDKQLAKIGRAAGDRPLHRLKAGTSIPVTKGNQEVYDAWRQECKAISARYYDGKYRVVDVERGFFALVQGKNLGDAQQLYVDA